MPYSKAHYYMLAILPITVLAFWQSYFGKLTDAPIEHHIHGITGTAWIVLIALQSWSIHQGNVSLHRLTGKALFILVPPMIGAFALVTHAGALKSVAGSVFYIKFGQALLTTDAMLTFSTAIQVYLALRFRRQVYLHSAFMISTVIGLLPPILSRLFAAIVPGMTIRGPDTLYRFEYCLQLSIVVSVVISLFMFWRYRRSGWPWILAAVLSASMLLLYLTLGQTELWQDYVAWLARQPAETVFIFGMLLGLVACFAGWKRGRTIVLKPAT